QRRPGHRARLRQGPAQRRHDENHHGRGVLPLTVFGTAGTPGTSTADAPDRAGLGRASEVPRRRGPFGVPHGTGLRRTPLLAWPAMARPGVAVQFRLPAQRLDRTRAELARTGPPAGGRRFLRRVLRTLHRRTSRQHPTILDRGRDTRLALRPLVGLMDPTSVDRHPPAGSQACHSRRPNREIRSVRRTNVGLRTVFTTSTTASSATSTSYCVSKVGSSRSTSATFRSTRRVT